ncbi:MAG: hypothetical protein Q8927_07840 [Bacteroidota bacterium]|nr:hypothetical protein [Bacteroidota bacterium]MDP4216099.1 hypothetical protein [Bacteroidota bacterium]MDP4245281.1 hypothetical protein [Bacteroidota bacterium]MDP4253062.1 hypothetical protein [Bacteroidota bacterium]MDP4260209.1 hypothetical protein [Bacteroidota bacterium]
MIRRIGFPIGLLLLVFSLNLVSCSKHNASADNCITRVTPRVTDIIVAPAVLDTIHGLFQANHLANPRIQFNGLHTDTWLDSNSQRVVVQQVTANYFVNGLPVFGGYLNYTFVNGRFIDSNALRIAGQPENDDTMGHQPLAVLRSVFYQYNPDYTGPCLKATLCYLDAGSIAPYTVPLGKVLVKVWAINPTPHGFPLVFVVDETGKSFPDILESIDGF